MITEPPPTIYRDYTVYIYIYAISTDSLVGVSILVDIAIMAVPILLFRDLQISTRKKVALIGVFLLGTL